MSRVWSKLGELIGFLAAGAFCIFMLAFIGSVLTNGSFDDYELDDDSRDPYSVYVEPEPTHSTYLEDYLSEVDQTRVWQCGYSPTYNDDWHDDVLCTNGVDQDRPYLLPDQSFITADDIEWAAREYEAALNGY